MRFVELWDQVQLLDDALACPIANPCYDIVDRTADRIRWVVFVEEDEVIPRGPVLGANDFVPSVG